LHAWHTRLESGLRVAAERLDGARTVAVGLWLDCGTRHESGAESGVCHFLEHAIFKGTARRDLLTIARELESLGGQTDAYTTHEATCLTLHVLPEHLARALDLLADLVTAASLDSAAVETERQVIAEEIREAEDNPSDLVQELCARRVWADHPLSQPVLGTLESVAALDAARLRAFRDDHWCADRVLLCAAGAVDGPTLADLAGQAFASLRPRAVPMPVDPPGFGPGLATRREDTEQVYLCLATPGLAAADPDRHALWALDLLLGGTMNSRLFQQVREQRGLAYQVGSSWHAQRDAGLMLIDAVASPAKVEELLRVVRAEVEDLAATGLSEEDLAWVKAYARTTLTLGAESMPAQMARIGRGFFYEDRFVALEETLAAVENLTTAGLQRTARRVFGGGPWALAAVGPITARRADRWWKAVGA